MKFDFIPHTTCINHFLYSRYIMFLTIKEHDMTDVFCLMFNLRHVEKCTSLSDINAFLYA